MLRSCHRLLQGRLQRRRNSSVGCHGGTRTVVGCRGLIRNRRAPRPTSARRCSRSCSIERDSFVRKASGVSEADARRALVGTGTTLLWLAKHLAQAESTWIVYRFAGDDNGLVDDTVHDGDTIEGALAAYRAMWDKVDGIAAAAALDDQCRRPTDEPPVNLRWVLMHLLEETARHTGHADIFRELIDGQTGR